MWCYLILRQRQAVPSIPGTAKSYGIAKKISQCQTNDQTMAAKAVDGFSGVRACRKKPAKEALFMGC